VKGKKKGKKCHKKSGAAALLARAGLEPSSGLADDSPWLLDPVQAANYAVKMALWPSQQMPGQAQGSINPGAPTPNPMAGQEAPPAQPLLPPDQAQGAPAAGGPPQDPNAGAGGTQPGNQPPSGPSSTSDQQRWQQMVLAPFAGIGQNSQNQDQGQGQGQGQMQDQGQVSPKQARAHLRSAVHEGRWDWLHKLAHALSPSSGWSRRQRGHFIAQVEISVAVRESSASDTDGVIRDLGR
jgi:hypothetical protein